ncbi:MAG TPA: hypothetical protein VHR16_03885 [Candidatus Limnocylindrales bacterium]|nr:hypothetical protein [Candidatus Limnocylindrales bacterium]
MSESLFEQYKAALRRGHMALLAGELDNALAAYDDAARLVPDRALPLASRGTVLHRLDRWPEAAEAFDGALQLAPDDEGALRARAIARAERGMRSGAAADFEQLAFVLEGAGRTAPAAEAASRSLELEPSGSRQALADRLGTAAARLADLGPAPESAWAEPDGVATTMEGIGDEQQPEDPWSAALDARRLEGLGSSDLAEADREPAPDDAALTQPSEDVPGPRRSSGNDSVAYDMLDALRAGMDADEAPAAEAPTDAAAGVDAEGGAGTVPTHAEGSGDGADAEAAAARGDAGAEPETAAAPEGGGAWPPIDLPSPPPPPMVGPPPDPEELLAEAALVLEAGEVDAARDLMLTAVSVHRAAGRIDAALDICLNLLAIAPGEPRVHLAIANLQLDRGWSAVATEKLDLLVRLTSLTGDTQAEADVHGLASERLRDDPAASTAAR